MEHSILQRIAESTGLKRGSRTILLLCEAMVHSVNSPFINILLLAMQQTSESTNAILR